MAPLSTQKSLNRARPTVPDMVGNNLAAVLFSTATASLGAHLFADMPYTHSAWSLAAAVLMLFLGEYLPKLIFASRPLRRSLWAARPYRVAAWFLALPVAAFSMPPLYLTMLEISPFL